MVFGQAQIISISVYVTFFVIGLIFNSLSLKQLLEERIKRRMKTRMNLLLTHLAIADLMVILLQVPLEIGWTYTVSWAADDVTCRISVFLRIIGCYLSGFVLIVISLDRLYAVVYPIAHRYDWLICPVWPVWWWPWPGTRGTRPGGCWLSPGWPPRSAPSPRATSSSWSSTRWSRTTSSAPPLDPSNLKLL